MKKVEIKICIAIIITSFVAVSLSFLAFGSIAAYVLNV